jgi:hypothetical protein
MADWGFAEGSQRFGAQGIVTGSSSGTALSSPGATNTKGSYTQLVASTPFDAAGIIVSGGLSASAILSALIDIAVGAAGVEFVAVPDMNISRMSSTNVAIAPMFVAVAIPAGSRLAARVASNDTSALPTLSVSLIAAAPNYPILAGPVEALGADASTSKGAVIDPGGTANTKGAWVQLTASTARKTNWAAVSIQEENSPLGANWLIEIAIGAAGSEAIILDNLHIFGTAGLGPQCKFFLPMAIPAGVRVAARASCSSTSAGRNLMINMQVS